MDFTNLIAGFAEGFALIISPCILPILPIMLAGTITGSKKHAIGITTGFVITFAVFAFFSRMLVQYSGLDLDIIRIVAYVTLLLLGVTLISNRLTEQFERLAQRMMGASSRVTAINHPQRGFFNGLLFGGLVSIVWVPCAGPILAAVIVQTVIQQTTYMSFLILLAFAFGAALPMLVIAFYGKLLINRFGFIKTRSTLVRKWVGVMIIASVAWLVYQDHAGIEPVSAPTHIKIATGLQGGIWHPYPAPAIGGIETWFNSSPLSLSALKGHVILIDFWAYSCINCLRTLPYIKYYDKHYRDKGLVVIGVHTPEFAFEKKPENVKQAVNRYGIEYPVALDNQFVTWQNFQNRYWPAHYLINKQGQVVYEHFGEGDYDVVENNIRYLLGLDNLTVSQLATNESPSLTQTPETYLGYARADESFSPALVYNKANQYTFMQSLPVDTWSLQGRWQVLPDKIIAGEPNAAIKIHFHARHVYVVMGNGNNKPVQVHVLLNGKPLLTSQGKDVHNGTIVVDKETIYEVVALPREEDGILQLTTDSPGLEMYTFTFGGKPSTQPAENSAYRPLKS